MFLINASRPTSTFTLPKSAVCPIYTYFPHQCFPLSLVGKVSLFVFYFINSAPRNLFLAPLFPSSFLLQFFPLCPWMYRCRLDFACSSRSPLLLQRAPKSTITRTQIRKTAAASKRTKKDKEKYAPHQFKHLGILPSSTHPPWPLCSARYYDDRYSNNSCSETPIAYTATPATATASSRHSLNSSNANPKTNHHHDETPPRSSRRPRSFVACIDS